MCLYVWLTQLLAKEGYYNLDIPVSEALLSRPSDFTGIHTCAGTDTLGSILEAIQKAAIR
jgi:5'-AMP-activated protein kinase, regulatory gamma subunit